MKIFYSFIISCISILGYSQTILYQSESTSRTVQDPQTVILTQGFHATSNVSNPFIAKIGSGTVNQGGPVDSGAGAGNPTGTTAPQGQSFHDTEGNIGVNRAGQLEFSLPIDLPPGVKNVTPQISLVYNSGSGNGIAGYGWSISGITAISRIAKNIENAHEVKEIQLSYSDYYSFNGQRLILKSGEYGRDGAEYVTEKYSNTKIRSVGTENPAQPWQGPEYWEVTFEDGSQAWYGRNLDGRTPTEYNITEWKDPQGNYITYSYDQGDRVAIISTIKWGGNKDLNTPHMNIIQFNYKGRGLKEESYIQGLKFYQSKILSEIKVFTNNAQFKRYSIEYTDNGTNYQFANKITEYNAEDDHATDVILNYPPMANSSYAEYIAEPDPFDNVKLVGDFNGDSYLDFLMNNGTVKLGAFNETFSNISTGKVFAANAKVVSTLLDEQGQVYNGNGIVEYKDGKVLGYIFRENTFVKVFERNLLLGSPDDMTTLDVGDLDGDGIPDLFVDDGDQGAFNTKAVVDLKYPSTGFSYIISSINENSYPDQHYTDIDGDGKAEIISVSGSQYTVFEFVKYDTTHYEKKIRFSGNLLEAKDSEFPVLFGDFNGDGKLDFTIPITDYAIGKADDWRFYMGTEKGFAPFLKKEFFTYRKFQKEMTGNYAKFAKQYFFSVTDMNKDGKSDIVQVFSYNQINPFQGNGYREFGYVVSAKMANGSEVDGTPNFTPNWSFQSPVYGTPDITDLTLFSPLTSPIKSGNNYYNVFLFWKQHLKKIKGPTPLSELARVSSITQGGVTTSVNYLEVVPDNAINPNFYKKERKEFYPYYSLSRADQLYAVSQLQQENRKQDFRYRGITGNMHGKKMMGYHQTAQSSWYADGFENTKIWSGSEIDTMNDGLPAKQWSIRTNIENNVFPADISENNTQLLSFESVRYKTDKLLNGQVVTVIPADKTKIVTAAVPNFTRTKDFLTGTFIQKVTTYGNYYLPSQIEINTDYGYAVSTTDFNYEHNPYGIGKDYYVGRPSNKLERIEAYGDTQNNITKYVYENGLLKTSTFFPGSNATNSITEEYSYDGFGNITTKKITSGIDGNSKTEKVKYDPEGRFIMSRIDNLGLETGITYNAWGQVLTQKDPDGNRITNTYDSWGKLSTSKRNLSGTTTYTYKKEGNGDIIVTEYSPDGDVLKKYTNKLGQNYKISTKAFGQGQYVSKETQYDLLGRKTKESEPYFEGQSVSKWNTFIYDDMVFPAKITATAFTGKQTETTVSGLTTTVKETNLADYGRTTSQTLDALGNIISSTDKGGTVHFSYNAAGQQIMAQYEENIVTTKYDDLGNKVYMEDPSTGVYQYEYLGYMGALSRITSPKGEKRYEYNTLGQLIRQFEKSSTGNETDKIIGFTYDSKGRVTSKSGTSKGKTYSSNISYDPQGRILSSSESSNGKYFIQKDIAYDDKARVISYEKQLYSSGVLTKVQIENVYSAWNGELYKVKDKITNKSLWELNQTNEKGLVLNAKLGSVDIINDYDITNSFLKEIRHNSAVKPSLLHIQYQFDAIKNELKSRVTGGDFNITESFDYDGNNRLVNWTNPVTGVKIHNGILNVYDAKGRILENDQVGTIKYENSAKIYQPTGMTLNAAGTQSYNNDLIQSIVYNENNDPVFIDGEKGDVAFQYGLSNMRQRVSYGGNFSTDGDGKFTKFYSEDGSFEVVKNNITGKEKHILYIGGTPYESNIIYLKNYDETNGSYKFLHKDYLGSILAISDEAGNKLEQRHFDAWGNFTHLQIGNGAIITDKNIIDATSLLVERGYTSHEHFAEVGIIHMNGRLYDPLLRRFLNADENIQAPFNTQNYNRYGYVANNPLMYIDPSGEVAWIVVGAVVGAVAGAYFTGVKANGSWNPAKWNWGATWGKIAMGGAIGAFTGVVGAAVGVSAAAYAATAWGINGGLLGGAIAGASGGAVAGAINGFATSVMFGENVIEGTLVGGLSGAAIGGVVGGVSGAIGQVVKNAQAAKIGAPQGTILKDAPIQVGRSQWTLNNTAKIAPKTTTIGKTPKIIIGEVERLPDPKPTNVKKLDVHDCVDCQNPRFIFDSKGKGLDLEYFNGLTQNPNTSIITGGKGGQNIVNMSGPPNSYTNLNNGHIVVYGPQGKPIFDVDAVRVKGIFYNTTPSGKVIPSFGHGTKFNGTTPKSLIDFFGL